jgi:hypothetical protein
MLTKPRIARKWEIIFWFWMKKKNNEVRFLRLILSDKKGTYIISNFNLSPKSNTWIRSLHPYANTSIQFLTQSEMGIVGSNVLQNHLAMERKNGRASRAK